MRLHELAKELNTDCKTLATAIRGHGVYMPDKGAMKTVHEEQVVKMREVFKVEESAVLNTAFDNTKTGEEVKEENNPVFTPHPEPEKVIMAESCAKETEEIEEEIIDIEGEEQLKRVATTPWKASKLLEIPERYKDPRFVYRWADKDKPGNIRKKRSEGWEIDKVLSRKMGSLLPTVNDGSNTDGTMQVRELIVMKIPKELAKKRNDFYAKKSKTSIQDQQEQFKSQVPTAYGEISEGS